MCLVVLVKILKLVSQSCEELSQSKKFVWVIIMEYTLSVGNYLNAKLPTHAPRRMDQLVKTGHTDKGNCTLHSQEKLSSLLCKLMLVFYLNMKGCSYLFLVCIVCMHAALHCATNGCPCTDQHCWKLSCYSKCSEGNFELG